MRVVREFYAVRTRCVVEWLFLSAFLFFPLFLFLSLSLSYWHYSYPSLRPHVPICTSLSLSFSLSDSLPCSHLDEITVNMRMGFVLGVGANDDHNETA